MRRGSGLTSFLLLLWLAVLPSCAGQPAGEWGGISLQHPFGVEWGTGRDIFAQLLFGIRISLIIATTATIITITIATVVGIIAGATLFVAEE